MIDEILVDHLPGETRAALLAKGRLVELRIIRPERASMVGAIIRGRVTALRRDQGAAFVEIGQAKAGFLSLRKGAKPPAEGAAIVVQVAKDAVDDKGAGLSDRPAIVGQRLTLRLGQPGLERTRRLDPEEFARLAAALAPVDTARDGFLLHPAAAEAEPAALLAEAQGLVDAWRQAREKAGAVPSVVRPAPDPVLRAILDHTATLAAVRFDDARTMNRIKAEAPSLAPLLSHHRGGSLFQRHDAEEQIAEALSRRIRLPRGGAIAIDELESMTAIDVDMAAQAGMGQQADLAFQVNLEAAGEIARQLRLRDIGGIVVVDFLRMARPDHRRRTVETLRRACAPDPQQVDVLGLTPAGLVELTRKRLRPSLKHLLAEPRDDQPGFTAATLGFALARAILREADAAPGRALRARASPAAVAGLETAAETLASLRERVGAKIGLVADPDLQPGRFDVARE
ncbi:MAG: ribonuclease E/G [Alphaproteobacteria bacterium]|nr:ribonuclease E/G [Alphaproteobacteria bacterium]